MEITKKSSGFSECGLWHYERFLDPMSDGYSFYLKTMDLENIDNYDRKEAKYLNIRKLPGKYPTLFLSWSDYLADNNTIYWRLDKGEVTQSNWSRGSGKTSLFFKGKHQKLKDFIKKLLSSDKISFSVKSYTTIYTSAVFDLKGLGEVILPHLNELGWEELEKFIEENDSG